MNIHPIARFHSPFSSKFGIPKQSNLIAELEGTVVFEPEYRSRDALRGIEAFDYLWLIWEFSANPRRAGSFLVRPPLLGGNEKMGVFATRSPFRPNAIGLSSVKLLRVEWETALGPVIHVLGGDLMDGTPIYDIKPYVPYADAHPNARGGFVDHHPIRRLRVEIPSALARRFDAQALQVLTKTLELDPRPHYQADPTREYGMPFMDFDVHFRVEGDMLTVVSLQDKR